MAATLLGAVHDKADGRLVEGVEHRQVRTARVAEDVLDTILHERVV
jgi:hypothetical protein